MVPKRLWAKALLAVRAAGRIGGTTNVRMSKLFNRISDMVPYKYKIEYVSCLRFVSRNQRCEGASEAIKI